MTIRRKVTSPVALGAPAAPVGTAAAPARPPLVRLRTALRAGNPVVAYDAAHDVWLT